MNSRVALWVITAFVVGAVAPLLGLLAAAFAFGSWWTGGGKDKLADSQLMGEIREIEKKENRK